jgi:predicted Zn-dependent protease
MAKTPIILRAAFIRRAACFERVAFGALAALALGLFVPACSTNPATGRSQLNLIPESQEIALGREADADIVASMGVYPDDALQAYVEGLGRVLASRSERPSLPWTFRVLDDPIVNAFALPGGHVYVTRGILAHLDSEAELVGVLGHEIGHVTARHGVNQLSKQQLAGLGLGLGAAVSPGMERFSQLASTGLGLLFLKYSRDDERQADELGLRYALRGGWDPREIPEVFAVLERVSQAEGGGRAPTWLATHPDPGQRREWMRAQVARLDVDLSGYRVERRGYQRHLEGLAFGADPRQGFFEEDRFYQPELAFSIELPNGWQHENQRQAVTAASDARDAIVQLTLAANADPAAGVREFLAQDGVTGGGVESANVHGLPAARAVFEVAREGQTSLAGTVAFVRDGSRGYRLLGLTTSDRWTAYESALDGALGSFRRVTDRRVLDVQPRRLALVDLERGLTLEEFQRQYPSTVPLQTLGLINRLDAAGRLPTSELVKRVVGGPGR